MKRIYRHPFGNFVLSAAITAGLLAAIIACLPKLT